MFNLWTLAQYSLNVHCVQWICCLVITLLWSVLKIFNVYYVIHKIFVIVRLSEIILLYYVMNCYVMWSYLKQNIGWINLICYIIEYITLRYVYLYSVFARDSARDRERCIRIVKTMHIISNSLFILYAWYWLQRHLPG